PLAGHEVATHDRLRGKADRVDHAVEVRHVLTHRIGKAREVLGVGDIQLDHRGCVREPLRNGLRDLEGAAYPGQHHGGTLFLGEACDIKCNRAFREDARYEDVLTVEDSHHVSVHSGEI